MKWKKGQQYLCIHSGSLAYKKGNTYTCYENEKGNLCLRGEDGLEDLCVMLVSSFKPTEGHSGASEDSQAPTPSENPKPA